jgi:hypothetical protein
MPIAMVCDRPLQGDANRADNSIANSGRILSAACYAQDSMLPCYRRSESGSAGVFLCLRALRRTLTLPLAVFANLYLSTQVPEPAPLTLIGIGLVGLAFTRRRKQ